MDSKNFRLYVRNILYFIVDEYQKDTCFYDENACYYDIDVDRIPLFKQCDNKFLIGYEDLNKMNIVPLQLKIKNFCYEIHDDDGYNEMIYMKK